jgi:three-Cys-motif partner protein
MKKRLNFGGSWTHEKLEKVRKYLAAYVKIMTKQRFQFMYIDAFAGTGYLDNTLKSNSQQKFLVDENDDTKSYKEGSAKIALQIEPAFNKYIFIEKEEGNIESLNHLRDEAFSIGKNIVIINQDCNLYLLELCRKVNWLNTRAVLFLDPYGMEVKWETLVAISETKAIDLWILFPLGVAVNRMLTKSGEIDAKWTEILNNLFGTNDWYDTFYKTKSILEIWGEKKETIKISTFDLISEYFVKRLKTIFAGVAENPLPLYNSRNNPLFLLCFTASNPKGSATAIKIAQDILKRKNGLH